MSRAIIGMRPCNDMHFVHEHCFEREWQLTKVFIYIFQIECIVSSSSFLDRSIILAFAFVLSVDSSAVGIRRSILGAVKQFGIFEEFAIVIVILHELFVGKPLIPSRIPSKVVDFVAPFTLALFLDLDNRCWIKMFVAEVVFSENALIQFPPSSLFRILVGLHHFNIRAMISHRRTDTAAVHGFDVFKRIVKRVNSERAKGKSQKNQITMKHI